MRKSNEDLWQSLGKCQYAWTPRETVSMDAFAEVVRADEAEHVRHECAEVATQYIHSYGKWNVRFCGGIETAILSTGKTPVLKPGMLAVNTEFPTRPFVWHSDPGDPHQLFRPLTRAEIDEYRERAPE